MKKVKILLFCVVLLSFADMASAFDGGPPPDNNTAVGIGVGISGSQSDQSQSQSQTQSQDQEQSMISSGNSDSSSGASVSGSGNSDVNNTITYEYPVDLLTPQMINPTVLDENLFSVLLGMKFSIDGIPVIVVDQRNLAAVKMAISVGEVGILGTGQNHGKKFLATLHSRDGEYVAPIEQIRETLSDMPEGTKCVVVEIVTITHTRGSAGIAGAGNQDGSLTSALSANLAGSMPVPVAMTTITFLDRDIEIINCYDPAHYDDKVCNSAKKKEE